MSFRGAGDPRDGPQGPAAQGREPGSHEHRAANNWQSRVFIGSGSGPAARPGTTAWYSNQFPDSSPPALPTPQGHETRYHPLSRQRPGPTCATHGTELGGESPLRAARSGTDSQRQLRRSDAGWGGSRRQIGGPTNRHRIQGQCGGATRRGTGAPDTPSVHRKGRSGGCPEKVQCITVGDLPSSPGEPEQGVGDGVRWPGRGQPRP